MTKIQWTDKTANPLKEAIEVDGQLFSNGNYCVPISPGCKNCYASTLNAAGTRFGGNGRKFGVRPEGHPEMWLDLPMLRKWGRMKTRHKIFVGSMTDIFGEWVPDQMICQLFNAMTAAPLQTFQLLTKRPQNLSRVAGIWFYKYPNRMWPNWIWFGTSAEDQTRLDERLIWLIRTRAAVRFLSLEPLLGPIEIPDQDSGTALALQDDDPFQLSYPVDYIDWIIIGGESGPHARPLQLAWVEDILRQCETAGVPAFVKQLGSHWAKRTGAAHRKGGDPAEWPERLRVRMMPGEAWGC